MKKTLLFLALVPLFAYSQPQEANLLGTWNRDDIIGTALYNNAYNEIWGIAKGGKEYAIIGSTQGTHFIDITDPTQPLERFYIPGAAQGDHIIHRDYHDYQGYLYAVSDEGSSTLQIIDLSQLPDTIRVVYDESTLIRRAHNIFIDTAQAILYAFATAGSSSGYAAMRLFDLSNPVSPQFIAEYNTFGDINAGHVHDGYVRNGLAYLNCGPSGFAIVDFRNPNNPQTLSTLTTYPSAGYNHSGWATDDCGYYYMADENHGADMKILDVQNPCDAEVVGTFDAEVTAPTSIPHNQIVACGYLYVSYYYDGLRVYDISDPTNPEQVLYYDTSTEPDGANYKGAWGIYPLLPSGNILISDMQNGLFVFEGMGDNCAAVQQLDDCDIDCGMTTSTEDTDKITDLEVYPIPTNGALNVNISLTEGQNRVKFELVDITGRAVQRFKESNLRAGINQFTFELNPQLSPGFYYLKIGNESFQTAQSVILSPD